MQKEQIKAIWDRYSTGKASKEEIALLESWYLKYEHLDREVLTETEIAERLAAVGVRLPLSRKTIKLWPRIAAAASIVIVFSIGVWFYTSKSFVSRTVEIVNQLDLAPGKNTATLTLTNGKTIKLSDAKNGVIIDAFSLAYNDGSKVEGSVKDTNAIAGSASTDDAQLIASTPRGGQYQITLPDGTKVWLNADTRLKFPQNFAKMKERIVVLKGEAYFEVTKDKVHPFIVKTERQQVTVLGTHFNINSYSDETSTKTTLLEGSVQILPLMSRMSNVVPQNPYLLRPGQEGSVNTHNEVKVSEVDAEAAVAWKNGVFQFYRADVKTVMRQLARWYNVEVEYQGAIPDHEFTGKIFRKVNASEALSILSELDVKFKIDGRKIIVRP